MPRPVMGRFTPRQAQAWVKFRTGRLKALSVTPEYQNLALARDLAWLVVGILGLDLDWVWLNGIWKSGSSDLWILYLQITVELVIPTV